MPAVRLSTGEPLRVVCSEATALALGMIPAARAVGVQLEAHGLVIWVSCDRPYPLLRKHYWWAWERGPGDGLEEV